MHIDLKREEITSILKQKFGDATFRVFYEENDKEYESRTREKISELTAAPKKIEYVVHF